MDKMLLIDLETQSFDVSSGIYEVASLAVENYQVVDQLYLGKEIVGYKGERKYGFGFYDISQDTEFIARFQKFFYKYQYPVVAHNCPFDRKFLFYYGWIPQDHPTYCSMRAIRMAENSLNSYSLQSLITHYRVADKVEHTALSDIVNLYKIINIIKPKTWLPIGDSGSKAHWSRKIKPRALEDIDLNINTTQILAGEIVCFTGKSKYARNTMQEIAIKNGAEISDSISAKTTILVVGIDAGSKLDKAQEKGISIVSDEEFMQVVNIKDI